METRIQRDKLAQGRDAAIIAAGGGVALTGASLAHTAHRAGRAVQQTGAAVQDAAHRAGRTVQQTGAAVQDAAQDAAQAVKDAPRAAGKKVAKKIKKQFTTFPTFRRLAKAMTRAAAADRLQYFDVGEDLETVRRTLKDVRRVQRRAKDTERGLRRGSRLVKDARAALKGQPREKDRAGRVKQREWEKQWAKSAAVSGAIATGIVASNPELRGRVGQAARRAASVIAAKRRGLRVLGSGRGETVTALATAREDWAIDRISQRQARVSAPGTQKRQRRQKRPHERVENERKLRNAVTIGAAGLGFLAGRQIKAKGLSLRPSKPMPTTKGPAAMKSSRRRKPPVRRPQPKPSPSRTITPFLPARGA